jgi:hypothetical protein
MIGRFEILLGLLESFARDADPDARSGAWRSSGEHPRQVQPYDVFAGKHVGLARRPVGIAPSRFELQPKHIDIKRLIDFQIAHRNGNVVDAFDAKTYFCNHG